MSTGYIKRCLIIRNSFGPWMHKQVRGASGRVCVHAVVGRTKKSKNHTQLCVGNKNKICNSNHDNNHHNNSNGSKNASNVKNWIVLIQGWGLWQCSEVRSLSPMYIYMYIDIVLYTVYYILYIIYYILYTGYLHICIHIIHIHYIETLSIYV